MPKRDWNKSRGVLATIFSSQRLEAQEPLPVELMCDSKLIRTPLNRYYLRLSETAPLVSENQAPEAFSDSTIALNPGVRTFQTGFDAEGQFVELGLQPRYQFEPLYRKVDAYRSMLSHQSVPHPQPSKQSMGAKLRKVRRKVLKWNVKLRNKVRQLHHHTAKYLCERYRTILLPVFETRKMVQKKLKQTQGQTKKRVIGNKTVRNMMTLSHGKFHEVLKHKAQKYSPSLPLRA